MKKLKAKKANPHNARAWFTQSAADASTAAENDMPELIDCDSDSDNEIKINKIKINILPDCLPESPHCLCMISQVNRQGQRMKAKAQDTSRMLHNDFDKAGRYWICGKKPRSCKFSKFDDGSDTKKRVVVLEDYFD